MGLTRCGFCGLIRDMKPKKRLINFKDPNISDREMLRLILFEIAKLNSDVIFIKEYLALPTTAARAFTGAGFCFCGVKGIL